MPAGAGHAVLGGADEFAGLLLDRAPDGFEDGFGVVDPHAHAQRHQHGHVEDGFPPRLLAEQLALAEAKEGAGRAGGQDEEAQAEDVLTPGMRLEGAEHREKRRIHQHRDEDHQRIDDRVGQVEEGLPLDAAREVRAQDARQELDAGLH